VAEQELDLVKFATGQMTEPSACSSEMPHAAFEKLYRIQNYAESKLKMLFWR
jgi:hypothetical protein